MQLFYSPSVTAIQSEEEKSLTTTEVINNSSLHLYSSEFPYTSNSKGLGKKKKCICTSDFISRVMIIMSF